MLSNVTGAAVGCGYAALVSKLGGLKARDGGELSFAVLVVAVGVAVVVAVVAAVVDGVLFALPMFTLPV